jgi:hypothetical protein
MIRFIFGLLVTMGAVGGLDNNGELLQCTILAVIGLAIMAWGVFDKLIIK